MNGEPVSRWVGTAEIRRLAPRHVPPGAAAALRALGAAPPVLELSADGLRADLSLGPAPAAEGAGRVWLSLAVGGAPAWAALTWASAAAAARQPLEGADAADAAMLVEAGLAAWFDAAEVLTGQPLRCLRLDGEAAPPEGMATIRRIARLRRQGADGRATELACELVLSLAAAAALASGLALGGTRPGAGLRDPAIALRVAVEQDAATLRLADLRSLAPGDAILATPGTCARLVVEDALAAELRREAGALRLAGPFRRIAPPAPHHEGIPMTDTPDQTPPAPLEAATLDDVELRVSFRAGEALMELSRLRALVPGAIVELPEPADGTVQIVVNGRVVGTGELIDLAGRRAVEIRTIFGRA